MAHFYRLIVLLLLAFSSSHVFAFPAKWGEMWGKSPGGPYIHSTPEVACQVESGRTVYPVENTPISWACNMYPDRNSPWIYVQKGEAYYCPANADLAGSQCSCSSGFEEKNQQCVAVDDRKKERACGTDFQYSGWGVGFGKYNDSWALDGKVQSGQKCDAYTDANPGGTGCKVNFGAQSHTKNDDGSWTTIGKFTAVSGERPGEGVPCTPDYEGEETDAVDEKPKECKGYTGTVNGVEKCIANSQNNGVEFAKTEKTEKKSDGTTVDTKVEQKCEGDKCTTTTTTTTKNAAGVVTGVDSNSKVQGKADFCKENADKCDAKGNPGVGGGTGSTNGSGGEDDEEEKSSFSGSCEAGFTCEGDAIQCAIAKKQHMTACQLEDTKNEFYQLFQTNKNKTGNVTDGLPGNKTENILSRLTGMGDDFLGSGAACPADRTIAFGFGEVVIPYSTLCPYLELMGRILVVLAAMSGAAIIIRRSS